LLLLKIETIRFDVGMQFFGPLCSAKAQISQA